MVPDPGNSNEIKCFEELSYYNVWKGGNGNNI